MPADGREREAPALQVTVRPEHCVHERSTVASCRACVAACPTGAWSIGEESLDLDETACDGCGLCVGACPMDALVAPTIGSLASARKQNVLDLACERSDTGALPTVPCLHATSPRELAALHRRGVRLLAVCAAPCAGCARAKVRHTLERSVAELALVLDAVNEQPLRMEAIPPAEWRRVAAERARVQDRPDPGRRGFFTRVLAAAAPAESPEDAFAALVARIEPGRRRPHVPLLDTTKCVACHACAQLCPTGAIGLERDAGRALYRLRPESCTACGLCVDVCEHDAVEVRHWVEWRQVVVQLEEHRCRACGVTFHTPEAATGQTPEGTIGELDRPDPVLCRICMLRRPTRNLYQVLP